MKWTLWSLVYASSPIHCLFVWNQSHSFLLQDYCFYNSGQISWNSFPPPFQDSFRFLWVPEKLIQYIQGMTVELLSETIPTLKSHSPHTSFASSHFHSWGYQISINRGLKPPRVPSNEILPGGFICKWLQKAEWKISEPKYSGLESFKPEQPLERKMKMGAGVGMSEHLMGQFQGSRCFFKRNILNYLILLHSEWEKKKKGLQHLCLRPHEFIESGCQGELRDGGVLSLTHPHTPPPTHAHIQELSIDLVKCLSFCPKQVNPGSKVLPFMLSSCFFLFKIKTTTFLKKGKQRKIE